MIINNTTIVCLTILIFTGIITYGIVVEDINESPYEQCLESCHFSDKIACAKICTEEFTGAIENLVNKVTPLIEQLIKNGGCSPEGK